MSITRREKEINQKYWTRFKFVGKSVEECKLLCSSNPACLSFEYGVTYGGSKNIYQPKDCLLRFDTTKTGCDGGDYNLDLYVKKSAQGNQCWSLNCKLIKKVTSNNYL